MVSFHNLFITHNLSEKIKKSINLITYNLQNKDLLVVIFSRLIVVIAQLGFVKLYSGKLSAYSIGVYALFGTISYILSATVFIPLDYYQQALIYPLREQGKSLMSLVYFNLKIFKWILLFTIISLPLLFIFNQSTLVIYFILAVMVAVSTYTAGALRGVLNNLEHKQAVAVIQVLEGIGKVGVLYLLFELLGHTAMEVIGTQLFVSVLIIPFSIYLSFYYLIYKGDIGEPIKWKKYLKFAYPIAIGAIINLAQLQGYRLLLAPMGFIEIIGKYFVVSQVGVVGMSIISIIYSQIYIPIVYKTKGGYLQVYLKNALLLISFVFVFSLIFSKALVSLLTKPEYSQYSILILYGILAEGCNLILGALGIYLTIKSKTRQMLLGSVLTATISVMVTYLLYIYNVISIYTIGVPIIMSQLFGVCYMYLIYKKCSYVFKSDT